jgi:hypothetical protein
MGHRERWLIRHGASQRRRPILDPSALAIARRLGTLLIV